MEVGDGRLESVEVVKFFEVMISGDGRIEEKIRSRTGKAARVIGVLNEPVRMLWPFKLKWSKTR